MAKTAQEYKEDFLNSWREEIEEKINIFQKYKMCLEKEEDNKKIWLDNPVYICPYSKFIKEIATHPSNVEFLKNEHVISIYKESPAKAYVIYNRELKVL